jgi:hypothetical protein
MAHANDVPQAWRVTWEGVGDEERLRWNAVAAAVGLEEAYCESWASPSRVVESVGATRGSQLFAPEGTEEIVEPNRSRF